MTSAGGWLDLTVRKLVAPPEDLLVAMRALEKTSDYAELASAIKDRA